MQLTANLSLNRYEWGSQVVDEALRFIDKSDKPVYYDIGSGERSLSSAIDSNVAFCHSFDLEPFDDKTKKWDIEDKFPFDYPAADIVTMLEVVEHLKNPWSCLKNVADIIKPGGLLVLTTPNPKWSTTRVNLLAKGFITCFTESDLLLNHHVFVALPHILERVLADNGFKIKSYVSLDGSTRLTDKGIKFSSFLLQFPSRLVKMIIEKTDATAIGMSYGVIAEKIG